MKQGDWCRTPKGFDLIHIIAVPNYRRRYILGCGLDFPLSKRPRPVIEGPICIPCRNWHKGWVCQHPGCEEPKAKGHLVCPTHLDDTPVVLSRWVAGDTKADLPPTARAAIRP